MFYSYSRIINNIFKQFTNFVHGMNKQKTNTPPIIKMVPLYSIWQNNQWFQEKQTEVNTSFVLWHSSRWYIVLFTHNMLLFLRSFAAVIELIWHPLLPYLSYTAIKPVFCSRLRIISAGSTNNDNHKSRNVIVTLIISNPYKKVHFTPGSKVCKLTFQSWPHKKVGDQFIFKQGNILYQFINIFFL